MTEITFREVGSRYWVYVDGMYLGVIFKNMLDVWCFYTDGPCSSSKAFRKIAKKLKQLNGGKQ